MVKILGFSASLAFNLAKFGCQPYAFTEFGAHVSTKIEIFKFSILFYFYSILFAGNPGRRTPWKQGVG